MRGGVCTSSSITSCSSTACITLLAGPPNLDKPPTLLLVEAAVDEANVLSPTPGVLYVCEVVWALVTAEDDVEWVRAGLRVAVWR